MKYAVALLALVATTGARRLPSTPSQKPVGDRPHGWGYPFNPGWGLDMPVDEEEDHKAVKQVKREEKVKTEPEKKATHAVWGVDQIAELNEIMMECLE